MKKVFEIKKSNSYHGHVHQYLMISEAKFIKDLCNSLGEITIKIVELPTAEYKRHFWNKKN